MIRCLALLLQEGWLWYVHVSDGCLLGLLADFGGRYWYEWNKMRYQSNISVGWDDLGWNPVCRPWGNDWEHR